MVHGEKRCILCAGATSTPVFAEKLRAHNAKNPPRCVFFWSFFPTRMCYHALHQYKQPLSHTSTFWNLRTNLKLSQTWLGRSLDAQDPICGISHQLVRNHHTKTGIETEQWWNLWFKKVSWCGHWKLGVNVRLVWTRQEQKQNSRRREVGPSVLERSDPNDASWCEHQELGCLTKCERAFGVNVFGVNLVWICLWRERVWHERISCEHVYGVNVCLVWTAWCEHVWCEHVCWCERVFRRQESKQNSTGTSRFVRTPLIRTEVNPVFWKPHFNLCCLMNMHA